ncbi:MAG: 50S ribosomal protein L11 methyltransferase [Defluviitaleaceae bacterium]|nr:50S ribosomal protein L11 methyltransferase [Defluviitaleaceae bacterium]
MEWTKARVRTTAYGAEVVTAVLMECNIVGVEIVDAHDRVKHLTETASQWDYAEDDLLRIDSEDVFVVFYVVKGEAGEVLLGDVREALARLCDESLGPLDVAVEHADDALWLNEWKKHFKPLRIGRVVIVPEWEEYAPLEGDVVFTLDPGSAFGTGQHQTTRLCVSALQKYLKAGDILVDIGCGSGILAITGLLLGASSVFACDIDPSGAMAATKKNAEINSVAGRLDVRSGDVLSDEGLRKEICRERCNIVVANIVADVIVDLLPFVNEILVCGGLFIASGIIAERAEEVLLAFGESGVDVLEKIELEGWYCIVGEVKHLF